MIAELLRVYLVYFLVLAGAFGLVLLVLWRSGFGRQLATISDGKGEL